MTNLFGGLLGSTFNYVFQNQMEDLQDGDRLYYLNRTPGMNLRTQLESNSFSEMIQRNTDGTNTLKADVFATADCKFQLGRPHQPVRRLADGFAARPGAAHGGTINDDRPPSATRTSCSCKPRRHDPVPGEEQHRPDRYQRPVGLQRHGR